MSSQPPYGSYPTQSQPWPEQPPDPSYLGNEQPGAYPPPSAYPPPPPYTYNAQPYPPQPGQQPAAPMYAPPNIYVQPAPYPYVIAAPPDPGAGQAVTSLVLGIVSTVLAFMAIIPCFFGIFGITTGIVGLVMGILGRKSATRHGMAVSGIVLSSIGLGLSVLFSVLWVALNIISLSTPPQ